MKTAALSAFRQRLARGLPVHGLWITLESPSITEMAVGLGLDWVVIDAEHGHLDWKEILEHLRATVRSRTVALVRIAERNTALTKRVLDLGADGIVIPWVESAAALTEAVRDCQYPPEGRRGIGGERATFWGECLVEHTRDANDRLLVVPVIESPTAAVAVPAMCRVPGIDVFFFGPADFSSSAGFRGRWEGPGVADQILAAKDTILAAGKHCGVVATDHGDLAARESQGFRMLGLGSDAGLLLRGIRQGLQCVGRDRAPATSFDPNDGTPVSET